MPQAISGLLGALGLCFVTLRGLMLNLNVDHTLVSGLIAFLAFAATGFCIGYIADKSMRESIQNRIKDEMAALNPAVESKNTSSKTVS